MSSYSRGPCFNEQVGPYLGGPLINLINFFRVAQIHNKNSTFCLLGGFTNVRITHFCIVLHVSETPVFNPHKMQNYEIIRGPIQLILIHAIYSWAPVFHTIENNLKTSFLFNSRFFSFSCWLTKHNNFSLYFQGPLSPGLSFVGLRWAPSV